MKSKSIEYPIGWKMLAIGYDWQNFDIGVRLNKRRISISIGFFWTSFGKD
jgi:hypothetical protein